MKKIIAIIIISLFFLIGCGGTPKDDITCNSPYIKFENGCCMDQNSNSICDDHEKGEQPNNQIIEQPQDDVPEIKTDQSPEAFADEIAKFLTDKNYDAMYDRFSSDLKNQYTKEELAFNYRTMGDPTQVKADGVKDIDNGKQVNFIAFFGGGERKLFSFVEIKNNEIIRVPVLEINIIKACEQDDDFQKKPSDREVSQCVYDYAVMAQKPSICDKAEQFLAECYLALKQELTFDSCKKMVGIGEPYQPKCAAYVAYQSKDTNLCSKFKYNYMYGNLQKQTNRCLEFYKDIELGRLPSFD